MLEDMVMRRIASMRREEVKESGWRLYLYSLKELGLLGW
jgi:hypothetical protein